MAERDRSSSVSDALAACLQHRKIEVYQPQKHTPPEDTRYTSAQVVNIDLAQVTKADFAVFEFSNPSSGVGVEETTALSCGKPFYILCLDKTHLSAMVEGLASYGLCLAIIRYWDQAELLSKFEVQLEQDIPRISQILKIGNGASHLGQVVHYMRLVRGFSLDQLSAMVGISALTLEQLEQGNCPITLGLPIYEKLSKALDMASIRDLFDSYNHLGEIARRNLRLLEETFEDQRFGLTYAQYKRFLVTYANTFDNIEYTQADMLLKIYSMPS
jgi:transcriptional regulator with XRE-family HTH domain